MIEHAKNTLHLVEENLEIFYQKQLDTVKNFVKICELNFL